MNPLAGGRKWRAFLILSGMLVLFVMTGKLTDQTVIGYTMAGLMGLFGAANVAEKFTPKVSQ
jgi:hypothetical protein